ncbi:ATP-binding protein [Streptomyces sp. NPDC088400]|uniref:ATP-binding protein n=1 Tax=Streptomyces sp. NPDC088400 TaxID=3365861 RepID=UPI0038038F68
MATVSPPWAYTLQLPRDPRAPGVARSTLRHVLDAHRIKELADTAELLASELVTNAYQHSDGPYTLRIRAFGPYRLRVGVWDGNPEIPPPFNGAAPPVPAESGGLTGGLSESGRGLQLVRLCADDWGAYRLGGGGKLLWVECVRQEPEPPGAGAA